LETDGETTKRVSTFVMLVVTFAVLFLAHDDLGFAQADPSDVFKEDSLGTKQTLRLLQNLGERSPIAMIDRLQQHRCNRSIDQQTTKRSEELFAKDIDRQLPCSNNSLLHVLLTLELLLE
jgi:hypothetical protein